MPGVRWSGGTRPRHGRAVLGAQASAATPGPQARAPYRAGRDAEVKRKKKDRRSDGTFLVSIHFRGGWFYERAMGIEVVIAQGGIVSIPFRKLASSLRRIAKARGVRL